ncbi:MAG: alkaline phosphatase family protein [Bacteroidetes bacterium]|nr:alkaline phosphatase family protein [Bacteroidota bacterium]
MRVSLILSFLIALSANAQKQNTPPKLVVGIVVDQMMYDYLYRFEERFSKHGIRKLMDKGTNCRSTFYNYVPTYTGPGHASIYTGTTPNNHGIVANEWFDRAKQEIIGCVQDSNFFSVGTESNDGVCSPKNLWCNTITDQLRMTYPTSKVFSASIKDRGAILPGGHLTNDSYWYDYSSGHFITSEFYRNNLPQWAEVFNNKNYPSLKMKETWNTLYPIESYVASGPDDSPYEVVFPSKSSATFPYKFDEISGGKEDFKYFTSTPWANTYLTDFSIEGMINNELGKDKVTDFLAISYSSTDIIGHAFGPQSIEIEDVYLRLDLEFEKLFKAIEKQVGKNWVVFLTADHAVVPVPQMLIDQKLPGGYAFITENLRRLEESMIKKFGMSFLVAEENNNLYLDEELILFSEFKLSEIEEFVKEEVQKWDGVKRAFTSTDLQNQAVANEGNEMIKRGFDKYRSGNIIFQLYPGYLPKSTDTEKSRKGTSHGSQYTYDTHVPLLWYGKGIKAQEIFTNYEITDIVPTLVQIMNLAMPSCAQGKPILEILTED